MEAAEAARAVAVEAEVAAGPAPAVPGTWSFADIPCPPP